jgi:protein-S-isoprenylcysteine O-methyltransferase Ste14
VKLLITVFLVTYGVERVLETFWKREKIQGQILAPHTLPLLVSAHVLLYLVILWDWIGGEAREVSIWVSLVGCLMVVLSAAVRNWAVRTLGPYHSIHIEIRAHHELVRSGPYQWVRNPYYVSNMVEVLGLPLVTNVWPAILISMFLYVPVLVLRILSEERALERKFAASFARYKSEVPRIIPRLI